MACWGFVDIRYFLPALQFDPGQVSALQAVDQNLGSGNVGGNGDGAGIAQAQQGNGVRLIGPGVDGVAENSSISIRRRQSWRNRGSHRPRAPGYRQRTGSPQVSCTTLPVTPVANQFVLRQNTHIRLCKTGPKALCGNHGQSMRSSRWVPPIITIICIIS